MSAPEKLQSLLTSVESEVKGKDHVAIVGFSGVGKTVLLTLLNHALDNHFHDKYQDIRAHIAAGRPTLEKWETSMLDGQFPEKTQLSTREDMIIEMSRKGATSTTRQIHLPDISGEDFNAMCIEEAPSEDKVMQVFEMAKTKGKQHGLLSYTVYANMYLILLDCSKIKDWERLGTQHLQALTTIRDFKKVTKTAKNDNIENPIGIVLTKADTLPDPEVSAQEIVKTRMRRFYNGLESFHTGERDFFKVSVDVERDGNNEVADSSLRVRKPLTYSHDEYVRLLWWIHENLS